MREYMLRRYHRRRSETIEKLGGKCVKCGSTENLEFDHIDPKTKEKQYGKSFTSLAKDKLDKEIDKAQLLCRNCHEKKSIDDLGLKVAKGQHGTISSYRYCKCDECKGAWNKWMREYKRIWRKEKKLKEESVLK